MQAYCLYIAESRWFQNTIIAFILISAALLGIETMAFAKPYQDTLNAMQQIILGVFILELVIKHIAVTPEFYRFYKNPWNVFDLIIVLVALLPAAGQFAMIARVLRLLRVLRLISAIPQLRIIVTTLIGAIPNIMNVVMLLSIIFYIYAVAGYHLFHEHDPEHWRHLGIALLTLFRIATLEDWTDVMYKGMELSPYTWIFFVSFVVIGTFVIINLFIAVVLDSLDKAKTEQAKEVQDSVTIGDVKKEIEESRKALERLSTRLMMHELETMQADESASDKQKNDEGKKS